MCLFFRQNKTKLYKKFSLLCPKYLVSTLFPGCAGKLFVSSALFLFHRRFQRKASSGGRFLQLCEYNVALQSRGRLHHNGGKYCKKCYFIPIFLLMIWIKKFQNFLIQSTSLLILFCTVSLFLEYCVSSCGAAFTISHDYIITPNT